MFVFHGTADETVPLSGSTDMVQAIEAAGGTQVQYTEYAGAGHGIWGQVFNLESLYKDLKKCKLSDRYTKPEENPEQPTEFPWVPVLIGCGAGVVALAAIVVVVICTAKKKKSCKCNSQAKQD